MVAEKSQREDVVGEIVQEQMQLDSQNPYV